MAAAYYRVLLPCGSYVHGGNSREIRNAVDNMFHKYFPPGTTINFFWGHKRKLRCTITFGKRKRINWKDRSQS